MKKKNDPLLDDDTTLPLIAAMGDARDDDENDDDDDDSDEGEAARADDDEDDSADDESDEDEPVRSAEVESAFDDDPFARRRQTHARGERADEPGTDAATGEAEDVSAESAPIDDEAESDDDEADDDDPWDRRIDAMDESEPRAAAPREDEPLPEVSSEPAEIPIELIDKDALWVVKRLRAKGHEAYLTGGCVRDLLLGRRPKDFDVATAAHPNQVRSVFRNCRLIGRRFRLAHVIFPGNKVIETATFRANPLDVADDVPDDLLVSQDNVFGDVEQDARRRDLTVNGLFYDPLAGKVLDYVDGRRDLEQKLIRTIGDPEIRFQEDPVRIIRAIKFATRLGFEIEDATFAAMKNHVGGLARCAPARLQEELMRLLLSGHAAPALALCEEVGVLSVLLPELETGLLRELSGRTERFTRVVPVQQTTPTIVEPAPVDASVSVESMAGVDDGAPHETAESEAAPAPSPVATPAFTTIEEWRELVPLEPAARRARFRAHITALDQVIARGVDVDSAIAWATLLLAIAEAQRASTEGVEQWLDETGAAWTERIRFTRRDKDQSRVLLLGLDDLAPERRVVGQTQRTVTRGSFRDLLLLHTIALLAAGEPLDEIGRWKAAARHFGAPWRQPRRGERTREPRRHPSGERGGDRGGDRGDRGDRNDRGDRRGGRGRRRRSRR